LSQSVSIRAYLSAGLRGLLLGLAVTAVSGCAFIYPVEQKVLPQPTTAAMIQPWPLSVGMYIPPAVRSREFARQGWRVPVGEPAASNFQWTLEQMFARVVVLDAPPAKQALPDGLNGVVELSDIAYDFATPESLRYEIGLYSDAGERIESWPVTTTLPLWDIHESGLSALLVMNRGTELAYAMRDVTAQFMVHFADRPAVQTWLAGEGVAAAAVRPAFDGNGGTPPPAVPRILLVPNLGTWLYTDATRAMNCIGHRLAQARPPFEVVPADQVRLAFFPWLEPSTAPKSLEDLQRWAAEPAVHNKLHAIGARYLLEFHGDTQTEFPKGGILCGASFGAGGCLGFAWGSHESAFSATLLDMWEGGMPLDASATQRSGAYMPAFILPIPLMAPTESKACEELSQRIHDRLTQGDARQD